MPTPSQAFAVVAHALSDIDPEDRKAVGMFYRRQFTKYPLQVRALISDFLVGQTGVPSAAALEALKEAISLPVESIAEIEAPAWKGPAMEYLTPEGKPVPAEVKKDRPASTRNARTNEA